MRLASTSSAAPASRDERQRAEREQRRGGDIWKTPVVTGLSSPILDRAHCKPASSSAARKSGIVTRYPSSSRMANVPASSRIVPSMKPAIAILLAAARPRGLRRARTSTASSTRTAWRTSPTRRSTTATTCSRKSPGPRCAPPARPPTSGVPVAAPRRTTRVNPADRKHYTPLISAVAKEHQLDPALLHAVITVESGYNPKARSPKGAIGLMQLMPDTARRYDVADIWDPRDNLQRWSALPARPARGCSTTT